MPVVQRKRNQRVEFWRMRRPGQLTPEEQASVLIALKFAAAKVGGQQELAYRMGLERTAIRRAIKERPHPTAVMAWELSRVVGVSTEDIITGKYPPPGACPTCGGSAPIEVPDP